MCMCAQSYPTLCDLLDCSPPGSSLYGIFQARILLLSVLPFPTPGGCLSLGIEPISPASPALAGDFFTTEPAGTPTHTHIHVQKHLEVC